MTALGAVAIVVSFVGLAVAVAALSEARDAGRRRRRPRPKAPDATRGEFATTRRVPRRR